MLKSPENSGHGDSEKRSKKKITILFLAADGRGENIRLLFYGRWHK